MIGPRALGCRGYSSIGFDGSGSQEQEDAGGAGFANVLVRVCQRIVERGYRPGDALNMAAAANALLRAYRVSLCGNVADALVAHIPDEARPTERLLQEIGLPPDIRDQLLERVEAELDPEGEVLCGGRLVPSTCEGCFHGHGCFSQRLSCSSIAWDRARASTTRPSLSRS